jgi:hypothetical protein
MDSVISCSVVLLLISSGFQYQFSDRSFAPHRGIAFCDHKCLVVSRMQMTNHRFDNPITRLTVMELHYMRKLKQERFGEKDATEEEIARDLTCLVYRGIMEAENSKVLTCGDCFHIECLEQSLARQCPYALFRQWGMISGIGSLRPRRHHSLGCDLIYHNDLRRYWLRGRKSLLSFSRGWHRRAEE